jgi:hypothetical protein
MIFMMVEYGMNLTVQSTILFTKEGNYGCILNVDCSDHALFSSSTKGATKVFVFGSDFISGITPTSNIFSLRNL